MIKSCYRAIAVSALLVVLLILWDQPLLWPLKSFVVLLHEISHALAALFSGGRIVEMTLSVSEAGYTKTRGGSKVLILHAGYLGSMILGIALLLASKKEQASPKAAIVLALGLLTASGLLIRPIMEFTFQFAAGSGLALLLLSLLASPVVVGWVLRVVGASSVLYPLWDLRSQILGDSTTSSDAQKLASHYGYPDGLWGSAYIDPIWIWGGAWLIIGLLLLLVFRRLLV